MTFFIDTVDMSEGGAWVHLKTGRKLAYALDDEGKPDKSKPTRIKVYGPDSPTLQERDRARTARRIKSMGAETNVDKMSVADIQDMLESSEADGPEKWADATMEWENMPDGVPEFSRAAALELYAKYPAITRQLDAEAEAIADFLDIATGN